jgi:hypothetical protein
MRDNWKFG